MPIILRTLTALGGMALSTFCLASPAVAGLGQPQPVIALSGQVELSRLVDLAAQRLRLNIDYDAAALKGSVTLRLEAPLSDEDLWLLVNRVLAARGLTTVRMTGASTFSVVKLTDAPALARPSELPGAPEAGFKAVTVRPQYRSPKDVIDAISKVLSKPGGSVAALGDSGVFLITDLSERVDAALTILRVIDVPSTMVVREIPVRHLSAPALATLVSQVAAKRELVSGEKVPGEVVPSPTGSSVLLVSPADREASWRELLNELDQRQPITSISYTPRTFGLREVAGLIEQTIKTTPGRPPDDRFKIVADELTGSLIITATPEQHAQIAALVERLDRSPSSPARPVRSFVIKNRPVKEMESVLEQLLSAGVLGSSEASPSAEPLSGTEASSPSPLTPWPPPAPASPAPTPPTTAAPSPSQTVPPSTTPRELAPKRPAPAAANPARTEPPSEPLVSITSDEPTNTLIVMGAPRVLAQIEELLRDLDVRQPQVMLEVLIISLNDSQTLDLGVELEQFQLSSDVRIRLSSLFGLGIRGPGGDRAAGDGAGFTGLVLSPGEFSILIRALQTINHGRSLSIPKVLVANNQQGVIDSVLDQPFASTNASNTVTTTSFGGSKQAGTQVTIKPQIGAGDHLNLDYAVSLSAFVGAAASANLPPPRQENKVQSIATIPDGYTVAVGGIELRSEGEAVNQVPLISKVPILGELFKNRSKNSSRSRFYVFIRANVLRRTSFEDLKYASDRSTADAGVDDGFPEVQPRVIP